MSGSNRLAGLKARPKDTTVEEVRRVNEVGKARGFVDRTPRKTWAQTKSENPLAPPEGISKNRGGHCG